MAQGCIEIVISRFHLEPSWFHLEPRNPPSVPITVDHETCTLPCKRPATMAGP